MSFTEAVGNALASDFNGFKEFIASDKNIPNQHFWVDGGSQMTVLSHLVSEHQEKTRDLSQHIGYVVNSSSETNIAAALCLAASLRKAGLVNLMLASLQAHADVKFIVNQRNLEGRSLLSLILALKDKELLNEVLVKKADVHSPSNLTDARVPYQPLHQAIALDFSDGVRLLATHGAQLANPHGLMMDTPVLLAARLGKITALEALLESPIKNLDLEAKNKHFFSDKSSGHTAIEELCKRITKKQDTKASIRGVAMLLSCGAEPPSKEDLCHVLRDHRVTLLKEIKRYLVNKPELAEPFVNRCHLRESSLHNIIYADHSWGNSVRRFFGKPSNAALLVESLVDQKYAAVSSEPTLEAPNLQESGAPAEQETNKLKLYATFVRTYQRTYDDQIFTNRWSTMRWMIAEGMADWDTVLTYSKNHPASRTRMIVNDMQHTKPSIHDDAAAGSSI